jgi:hypothetical protein
MVEGREREEKEANRRNSEAHFCILSKFSTQKLKVSFLNTEPEPSLSSSSNANRHTDNCSLK